MFAKCLCPKCGGSGVSEDGRRDCPLCRGKGTITCKEVVIKDGSYSKVL